MENQNTENISEIQLRPADKMQTARQTSVGLMPRNFEEALMFANMIAASDLAPKGFIGKPGNVLVAIQMGAEVGLLPMQAVQNIAVINGRPSVWGDAALAIVQTHPGYVSHEEAFEGTGDNRCAVFTITRRSNPPHTTRFCVNDAKKAKLWGKEGPWTNYPDRMLQMRARGFGMRDKFADALRGLSIAEEAMDIPADVVIEAAERRAALPEDIKRKSELLAADPKEQAAELQKRVEEKRNEIANTNTDEPVQREPESTAVIAAGMDKELVGFGR